MSSAEGKDAYLKIVNHYLDCYREHGDTHKGVDWPNMEDLLTRYEVMLGLIRDKEPCSLLDFGCGTAMLYQYIKDRDLIHIDYKGLDLGKEYIAKAKQKFPSVDFYQTDILKNPDELPPFDYAVMNGVLTEKQSLSFDEMWSYTQELIAAVFQKANEGIAFNVMSKAVDWERDDLFHLPTDLLIDFVTKNLSRHFVIRNDYGLYEYTVYIYRNPWHK